MSTKKLQIIDYNIKQVENADTVDGKHASDFASAIDMTTAQSDISNLQTKVGDTAVSIQITSAINAIDADDMGIYVQSEEPLDAIDGDVWIDLDDAGVSADADTLDGQHASYFATASDMANLKTLVGDTSVFSQINNAMASVPQITYGTTDLTAGTSELATGSIHLVYEAV